MCIFMIVKGSRDNECQSAEVPWAVMIEAGKNLSEKSFSKEKKKFGGTEIKLGLYLNN